MVRYRVRGRIRGSVKGILFWFRVRVMFRV